MRDFVWSAIFLLCYKGVGVDGVEQTLVRGVHVPSFALVGGHVPLECHYRLNGTPLYSLKWYHNGTEFYRYVPTERVRPINIQPSLIFSVTEQYRTEERVVLSLGRLTLGATGEYRCEVIAEHPTFRTEAATAHLTVLSEQPSLPLVEGGEEVYAPSDVITLTCRPPQHSPPGYAPTLTWLVGGVQVRQDQVKMTTRRQRPALTLSLPARQVEAGGGSVRAECRMSLGKHSLSAYRILRVRHTHRALVTTLHSGASEKASSTLCLRLALTLILMAQVSYVAL